jgi:hypothetical protein
LGSAGTGERSIASRGKTQLDLDECQSLKHAHTVRIGPYRAQKRTRHVIRVAATVQVGDEGT